MVLDGDFGDGVSPLGGQDGQQAVGATVDGQGFGDLDGHGLEPAVDVVEGQAEQGPDPTVVDAGWDGLVPGVFPVGLPAADEVESLFEFLDEVWDFFGVILEVAVHGDDGFSAGLGKSRREGGGFACAFWEIDWLDGLGVCGQFAKDGGGSVGAAVVDKMDAILVGRGAPGDFLGQFRERMALVVYGDDEGDVHQVWLPQQAAILAQ